MISSSSISSEAILQRMLDNVPADLDKREGSVIHDALAPASLEMALAYLVMDKMLDEFFADTASRESLIEKAAERGITPHAATPAVWQVKITPEDLQLAAADRFRCGDLTFRVSKRVGSGLWNLTCETAGEAGNVLTERILPVANIGGLTSVTQVQLAEAGTDEESTEDFRKRYLDFLKTPASSGNANDYYNWAMSVDGVGAAKIFPLADGNGTVRIVIANADRKAAGTELVNRTAAYIDTVRPIGATVSVISAKEKKISVTASVTLHAGYSINAASSALAAALDTFLQSQAFNAPYISFAQIGNLLIDLNSVDDYEGLKVNGAAGNVTLTADEIAVPGTIQLEVKTA